MKYGKRLLLEAQGDWQDQYITYGHLKRLIQKCLPQHEMQVMGSSINSESGTMNPNPTVVFVSEIVDNIRRIERHFERILQQLVHEVGECTVPNEASPLIPSDSQIFASSPPREVELPTVPLMKCFPWFDTRLFNRQANRKLKLRQAYCLALRLLRYVDLNREGFRKIMKKHDKLLNVEKSHEIMSMVDDSFFMRQRHAVESLKDDIERKYYAEFQIYLNRYAAEIELSMAGQWTVKWFWLIFSAILLIASLYTPILKSNPEAHRCLALILTVVSLWLSEAMPFFCTAMFIPLLAVWMRVLTDRDTGLPLSPTKSSTILLSKLFGSTQILVLGGLVMTKAITKHNLDAHLAASLQRATGHNPYIYTLGFMYIGLILSAFISNIGAPMLLLSVIQETLWDMPSESGAPQTLLLGLAISCNLGGMMTPISSPQNAVAYQLLQEQNTPISFFSWILLAAPIGVLGVAFGWAMLILLWRPFHKVPYIPTEVGRKVSRGVTNKREMWLVLVVCGLTVVFWTAEPFTAEIFGGAAMVSLLPIVIFFGLGVLKKEDFNTLSWHILFLVAGGSMLGYCAMESRLLSIILENLNSVITNVNPWLVTTFVIFFVGLATSFVSHTVGAMILLPLLSGISALNPGMPSVQFLIFASVMMCSGAMAFPITSFPNVNSLLAEDSIGKPYLTTKNFILPGLLMTLFVFGILCTFLLPYSEWII